MNTATAQDYNYKFKLTDYALFDRNRPRKVAIYGRVSTEHEAQLSALENQLQWYDDQFRYHPNWEEYDRYIDEGITGTQAKKRPSFLRMIEDAKQHKFDLIVTREVCRFARNVVDTLVVTRELKNIGVEVFFIDDNIWTMDGDGELRLSLMATLAQEESRKTSERVKAGQKISRDNGVLYGCGNILGYDRVGNTYIINEEQAETVRMIFDLYLEGNGSMKIAGILNERKRKTATGLIKWTTWNVMRTIKNATYTGTICYNKSRSNNYLEQRRISNLDMDTYEYVKGDFPAIVSWEVWNKAQEIRINRKRETFVTEEKANIAYRESKDIWVQKLKCSCGSSFRRNQWNRHADGSKTFGYQCYNQINNGSKSKRESMGLDSTGYCDIKMIAAWKLDYMAKLIFEHLWKDRKESILIALNLIKKYYKDEQSFAANSTQKIQRELEMAEQKLANLVNMRISGEITSEEYKPLRDKINSEITNLKEALKNQPDISLKSTKPDYKTIEKVLNTYLDFEEEKIHPAIINKFVEKVVPISNSSYVWYINLSGNTRAHADLTLNGKKENPVFKLEDIESDFPLQSREHGLICSNQTSFSTPTYDTSLQHRQQSETNNSRFCKTKNPPGNPGGFFLFSCAYFLLTKI